jgi:hypothetical protein
MEFLEILNALFRSTELTFLPLLSFAEKLLRSDLIDGG